MRRLRGIVILSILMIGVGIFGSLMLLNTSYKKEVDIIELNSMAKKAASNWECLEKLNEETFQYAYTIFDVQGKRLYQSHNAHIDSIETAIKERQSYMNIYNEGKIIGTVVAQTNDEHMLKKQKWQIIRMIIGISIVEVLLLLLYTIRLYHRVLKPFEGLKKFASEVAKGNLDLPLEMDRDNVFGDFTESFDLMREELKVARKKEYEANQSKKELIASLSHDIKTPVTGIKLISELLELQVEEPNLKEKIHTIYDKAEQINGLITDMFQATLDELGELKVKPKDEYASSLETLFSRMDYEGIIHQGEIPECMIYMDIIRMEQVVNNIISNAYKYAKTPIEISYSYKTGYLQVEVKDYGEGVPEEELPLIFNKFYRGKGNQVQEQVGAGLGLYISKTLMEKMGGEMSCANVEDGFIVRLLIPLSCSELI